MKLPNAANAVIDREKIVDYLLDIDHPRGRTKAQLLISLGYSAPNWRQLEHDLRQVHLAEEVILTKETHGDSDTKSLLL